MLSIVIPTRDRAATLAETLSRVLAQRAPAGGFEVVVVDNGSTDRTPELLSQLAADHGPRFRHVLEPRPGPAAARNTGVAVAGGELVMFLGDDTKPASDDLLLDHVALHEKNPEPEYAVLGRVAWNERLPVTPLMRWLETGPQFAFELLEPGPVEPSAYLYTAQLSLKRAVFESVGGFDTRFPYAAVEDMELGIRLASKGLVLDYRPELLVLHTHPTPLARWLERMRLTGRSVALLERIHAEPRGPTVVVPRGVRYAAVRAVAPLLRRLGDLGPPPLRVLRWRILHHAAFARGYREGPPEPVDPAVPSTDDSGRRSR